MSATRTLEIRLSGRLADLLDEVVAETGEKPFAVAREALEIGLQRLKAERCPPQSGPA
jgi:hypothetical protein